mgnify:CR=1 FL=1
MLPKDVGLTSAEAKKRLSEHGPNKLPEKPPPTALVIFFSQLKSPLVYVLLVAGAITLVLGHASDTIIIFLAVLINTVLGFFQERKADQAVAALKGMLNPQAEVVRDGERKSVPVEEVVPGDVVVLNPGNKIPADGKLVDSNRFFVDEALLTGESVPVNKKDDDEVYMGTIATAGRAYLEVSAIGATTKMGKIAEKVQDLQEDTPLKIQLKKLSKSLSTLVLGLTLVVFIVGVFGGRDVVELFTTSVALAVSAIPEGLLVALTVVLAIGMQRILKKKGLVRHLVSAETLGGVTVICADKTGTLTQGRMSVVDAIGEKEDLAVQTVVANDLDDPIVLAAHEWGRKQLANPKGYLEKNKRLDSIPFSSKTRYFASLNDWDSKNNMIFVNGAPEFLIDWSILTDKKRKELKDEVQRLAGEGKRIVGLARKKVTKTRRTLSEKDVKSGLHFVGFLAFSDPVRPGVAEALSKTKNAGMKLIAITGDYAETAQTVLKILGIEVADEEIILGKDLARLNKIELKSRLSGDKSVKLFARTTPEQKLGIVEALQAKGEVVAMMGDGVNDAPAIKKADIGIVVGEATDVARETADLVLLDSSFATIVAAVEEGRGIFDNIRKIILYLLSDAFSEIIAVVGGMFLGLPLPVTATQILWINLASDGFPNLALTVDPKRKDIMNEPPRAPKTHLAASWMKLLIGIVSVFSGLTALVFFVYLLNIGESVEVARSVAFLILGVNSLFYVFSVRTLKEPFWRTDIFSNKWLLWAVFAGFGIQLFPFLTKVGREFFSVAILPLHYWMGAFAASVLMFIMIETTKVVVRKHTEWFQD